jgi:hypothetical protein
MGHKDSAQTERIFLEEWRHTTVRDQLRDNAGSGLSPGGSPLKRITKSDIDNYRLFKLRKTLSYAYDNASFYKELFDAHGIKLTHSTPGRIIQTGRAKKKVMDECSSGELR